MWVLMLAVEPRSLHLTLMGLFVFGAFTLVRRDWREWLVDRIARGAEADPPRETHIMQTLPLAIAHTPSRNDRAKLLAMHKKQRGQKKNKGRGRKAA